MPLVTVLMPVFNAERYLRLSIESILGQTFADFEFLIIDDGSTDTSRQIVGSFGDPRIRLVANVVNMGITETLNLGLQLASGDLVARQDADDISDPKRLERQVDFFRDHPATALIGTQGYAIDSAGRKVGSIIKACDWASIRWKMLFDNEFIHTSVMFRKDIVWGVCGGYQKILYCEDFDLWSRVLLQFPVANLPVPLVRYRVYSDSVTGSLTSCKFAVLDQGRRAIVATHLTAMGHPFSDREVEWLARFPDRIEGEEWPSFVTFFWNLLAGYERRFPSILQSHDYRGIVALQCSRLAYRVAKVDFSLACQVLRSGLGYSPTMVARSAAFLLARICCHSPQSAVFR
jgi:hypothetical protein